MACRTSQHRQACFYLSTISYFGFCLCYTPDVKSFKGLASALMNWQHSGLIVLVVIVAALHFSLIMQPAEPVFDEQYYVPAAQTILQGQGTDRIEHPPLGQLLIAAGIGLFGDNPFGWRVFSVLFGLAGIVLFYLVCLRLELRHKEAFLATFLLAFENLTFVQSGLAMLDVFSLTLMLASFSLYLRGNHTASAAFVALAGLAKLTGLLALPVIVLHWLATNRKDLRPLLTQVIAVPVVFLLLLPLLDLAVWHHWLNPLSRLKDILEISSGSTFAKYPSPMLSRPWDWLLHPVILTYWIEPHYLAMISPTLWALIIPAIVFALYKAWKRSPAAIFALAWFAGAYLLWIPGSLLGDRLSYIYYFYPAVGAVCLALALAAFNLEKYREGWQSGKGRTLAGLILPLYLLLSLGAFVILTPVSWWWKVPLCAAAYFFARWFLSGEGPVKQLRVPEKLSTVMEE
jgi:dolichyl-phosphate-mannose-protein mannosyltransferase